MMNKLIALTTFTAVATPAFANSVAVPVPATVPLVALGIAAMVVVRKFMK